MLQPTLQAMLQTMIQARGLTKTIDTGTHRVDILKGIDLSIAEDGVEAMQFLRRQGQYANAPRPDLILLDLNLPRKDGREVLAELKADTKLANIPVVVLTCSTSEQDMLRAQELQADSYITKPVEFMKFLNVVREVESFYIFVVALPPISVSGDAVLAGG